jgi:DNA-binding HxlR family transcriptional regulator
MNKNDNNNELPTICPVSTFLDLISNKWKLQIVWALLDGKKRFGELRKNVHGISQKVLADNLRAMEQDGLLTRTVYAEVPPRVEYELSELGNSLHDILGTVEQWAVGYIKSRDPELKFKDCAGHVF